MTYESVVAADTPIAWWILGEGSGSTVADSSGSGFTGTITGSPTFGQTGIPGSSATAMLFGSGNYIDFGDILNLSGDNTCSVEAWLKLPTGWGGTGSTVAFAPIITKGDVNWRVARNNTGAGLQANAQSGSSGNVNSNAVDCGDGAWHHVVYVVNSSSPGRTLYIDNVSRDTSLSTSNPTNSATAVRIAGNTGATSRIFPGVLAHVAVYDYTLNSTQVGNHYTAGATAAPTTPAVRQYRPAVMRASNR